MKMLYLNNRSIPRIAFMNKIDAYQETAAGVNRLTFMPRV